MRKSSTLDSIQVDKISKQLLEEKKEKYAKHFKKTNTRVFQDVQPEELRKNVLK